MLASIILNCYAATNNTPILLCAYGNTKNNDNVSRPILHPKLKSVTNAVDNFLSICYQTEIIIDKYKDRCSPYEREIVANFERFGVKGSTYREYINNLSNPSLEVCQRQYLRDKNLVLENISDSMFHSGSELYQKINDDMHSEIDEDYHNVDKLLRILNACQNEQRTKLTVLQNYENACGELTDEEKEMISCIFEDVTVNYELLLHIDYALNLLRHISRKWYYMICKEYNLKQNQTICQVRTVETQLIEAKKHLAILLWGCLDNESAVQNNTLAV